VQNYYSKIIVVELTDDPNKCVPIYREDVFYEGTWELCIKAATKQAQNAGTTAQQTGAQYGQQGSQIAGTLTPALTQEATHPTGINPTDLNSMLVAGQQGAGGATSGVAGQAGLTAARTRNSGALSGVLDQAARTKQQANSGAALGVQGLNAQTKLKQQQEGLSGLEGLYGTDVNAGLKAQGLVPEDINSWANANKTGWLQNMNDTVRAFSSPFSFTKGL
jgi:hypothetical protein